MKYYKRGFLNPTEGMAAYGCWVNLDDDPEHYRHTSVEAGFTIGDCTRKVELDFYTYDESSYNDNVYKLNTLIDELIAFKINLAEACTTMKKNKYKELNDNTL